MNFPYILNSLFAARTCAPKCEPVRRLIRLQTPIWKGRCQIGSTCIGLVASQKTFCQEKRQSLYFLELNFERILHNTEYVLRCLKTVWNFWFLKSRNFGSLRLLSRTDPWTDRWTDRWTDSEILDYKRLKSELLVYSGVVLRGNNRCPKQAEGKSRRSGACSAPGVRKDEEFNP